MGKDNKKKEAKSNMRWRTGMINKKEREAMQRYGLDPSNYGYDRPGQHSENSGDYNDMQEDFLRAARNDYDTRRGLEAMAMSGKKKAEDLAKGGLNSASDVMNANNLQRKQHARMGNGGNFSSASDFAGVSYGSVERDRRKFTEANDAKYASKADLENMKPAEDPDRGFTDPEMTEESDKLKEAKERAGSWLGSESGSTPSPYAADDEQDGAAVSPATTEAKTDATSMLGAFKEKLKNKQNFKADF